MIKNLISFILCIALSLLLCIFVSGLGGLFIIILLCLSLLFSGILLAVTKKTLSVDASLSTAIASKGETMQLEITFSKTTVLPTSFIEVTLDMTPNMDTEHMRHFKVISARRDGDTVTIPIKTELCGEGTVFLSEIKLLDYMGIISSKLSPAQLSAASASVSIMPEIRDVGVQSEVLKSTSENAAANEDEDEESNEASMALTGVAGYEHRKYEIGDPLKRVNWKLSSKKDELMVRLDDKVLTATQDFILDYPVSQNPDKLYYQNADRIIEASLSMLSMLLMQGYESSYTYFHEGWKTIDVTDESGIIYLQEELAGIRPTPLEARFEKLSQTDSTMICFTTCMGNMWQELSAFSQPSGCSLVVSTESGIGKICTNVWRVNHDFEFTLL